MKKITDFFRLIGGLFMVFRMMLDRQFIEEAQDEHAYIEGGEEALRDLHRRRQQFKRGCRMFR